MLTRLSVTGGGGREFTFENFDNGHIVCHTMHDTDDAPHMWCDYIETFIKQGRDAKLVWDKPEAEMHPDIQFLQIPMFPSFNIWTRVELTLDTRYERYQICWNLGETSSVLGYLNPGEGRNVVRSLLIQKMETEDELEGICLSSGHNFTEEMQFKKRMQSKFAPAERWMIWTTETCIACQMKYLEIVDDDSLVPNRERSGVWNPYE